MEVNIENYTVRTMDEHNFGLYKTRAKGKLKGEQLEGEIEVHVGYYGNLASALKKLVNDSLLSNDGISVAKDVLDVVSSLEKKLDEEFSKVRTKDV